jgi:hypothetical protein
MSAVLQAPALPGFMSLADLKTYIDSEIEKGIEKALPDAVEKVLSDPKNHLFIKAVESVLAISEHKILKRLYTHDVMLGLKEPVEEDDYISIPERVKTLEQKTVLATEKPIETDPEATPVIETTKDRKACAIVEYLKTEARPNDFGEFVIGRKELTAFMQNMVEEGLRVKKVSRQLKADLFERSVKLFPGIVYIKKSPSGNKTQMLALKTSAKRTITHGITRKAPIGILV